MNIILTVYGVISGFIQVFWVHILIGAFLWIWLGKAGKVIVLFTTSVILARTISKFCTDSFEGSEFIKDLVRFAVVVAVFALGCVVAREIGL